MSVAIVVVLLLLAMHCALDTAVAVSTEMKDSKNLRRGGRSSGSMKVLQPVNSNNLVVQQASASQPATATQLGSSSCSASDVTLLSETAFEGDFKTGLRKDVVVYFYKPNPNCPACKVFKP